MEYMRLTLKPEETKKSQSECGGVEREAGGKAQNKQSESQGRVSRGGECNRPGQVLPKAEWGQRRIHKVWDPGSLTRPQVQGGLRTADRLRWVKRKLEGKRQEWQVQTPHSRCFPPSGSIAGQKWRWGCGIMWGVGVLGQCYSETDRSPRAWFIFTCHLLLWWSGEIYRPYLKMTFLNA